MEKHARDHPHYTYIAFDLSENVEARTRELCQIYIRLHCFGVRADLSEDSAFIRDLTYMMQLEAALMMLGSTSNEQLPGFLGSIQMFSICFIGQDQPLISELIHEYYHPPRYIQFINEGLRLASEIVGYTYSLKGCIFDSGSHVYIVEANGLATKVFPSKRWTIFEMQETIHHSQFTLAEYYIHNSTSGTDS